MSTKSGIDYGLGQTNIDTATGIRYGVIHSNEVGAAWYEDAEADYGPPTCPKCGNPAITIPSHSEQLENGVAIHNDIPDAYEDFEVSRHACGDYACEDCQLLFDGEEAFPEEALGFTYDRHEYLAKQSGSDCDIFVTKSPYYTLCQFCSPCAPGAGYLINEGNVKAYCFGHEWFEDSRAPYTVYSVATGAVIEPDEQSERR